MSINNFTVIIRSSDKDITTDNTNDCYIRLNCPSHFKYIECDIKQFYFTTVVNETYGTDIFDLRSDNLNLKNHFDTKNTIAMNNLLSNGVANAKMRFTAENFNNQRIHFQLFTEYNILVQSVVNNVSNNYNNPWILVLNCVGYN
jgi:hypothetical protein